MNSLFYFFFNIYNYISVLFIQFNTKLIYNSFIKKIHIAFTLIILINYIVCTYAPQSMLLNTFIIYINFFKIY